MRTAGRKASLCILIAMVGSLVGALLLRAQDYERDSEPKLFSYDELVQLSLDRQLSPELTEKLRVITTTPFINNEAWMVTHSAGGSERPSERCRCLPRLDPALAIRVSALPNRLIEHGAVCRNSPASNDPLGRITSKQPRH
jgi:hypothetical protein